MIALVVLLLVAASGFALAQWLRLPVIPILLLLGMLLAALGLQPESEFSQHILELGLTVLVFASGIELNPRRFGRYARAVVWVGTIQFSLAGLFGFGLARLLGFDALTSLYLAFALSASSTLVVLRHLKQQRQMFEPFGRLVIGVLLLQDLLMIVLIIVLARSNEGFSSVVIGLGSAAALGVLALLCQRWLMPLLVIRLKLEEETLLLSVLAVLFTFVALAFRLNLPMITGAFLAGWACSAFPVNGVVRGLITSLNDFFVAIFFTALGALVIIPDWPALLQGLALALAVLLITPPLVTAVAEWTGFSSRAAIESGLLLAQTSEFSLVLGLTGLMLGHVSAEVFSVIALIAAVTMTLTPFVATDAVTRRLLHFHPLRHRLKEEVAHRGHVLVLGFGSAGMWVIKPLQSAGHEILVVDDDPAVILKLQQMNIPCLRGDGSDEKLLAKAGARQARLIVASMRRPDDAEKVLRSAPGVPVVVRVFEKSAAEHIRQLGGHPILNSMAAAETFLEWFHKTGPHRAGESEAQRSKVKAQEKR